MSQQVRRLIGIAALCAALALVLVVVSCSRGQLAGSGAANTTAAALKTTWGDPDLQGIWTDDYATPLQRPAKYAGKEFFTDAERAELNRQSAAILRREYRDRDAQGKGTEQDV